MKGQNSPEVANQGWPCVILWSPKLFTCKEFLKKWPHWGSCECTGWRTPNTVLYMEEKPRGENRFWWISTGWPISDRKSRGVCCPVSRKEGVGDSKHLLQGREGGDFCFYWLFLNRKTEGFSAALMCKELQGINSRQAFTSTIARLAFPHQIVQHNRFISLSAMLGDNIWQFCLCQFDIRMAEMWSCPGVFQLCGIRHVSVQ